MGAAHQGLEVEPKLSGPVVPSHRAACTLPSISHPVLCNDVFCLFLSWEGRAFKGACMAAFPGDTASALTCK